MVKELLKDAGSAYSRYWCVGRPTGSVPAGLPRLIEKLPVEYYGATLH